MIKWIEPRSAAVSACLSVILLLGTSITAVAAPPGDDTVNIQYTLEGCREPGTYTAPNALCADNEYTTGNLGKDWEELDFVPHRATLSAGQGQTTVATSFALAADFEYGSAGGYKGYDAVTEPTINGALSDDSCVLTAIGAETVGPSLAGGVFSSKYRIITLSQDPGTTCVLDYYLRLAGPEQASLYSGASLHAYLLNPELESAGIGEKRVPLPVNEVEPQELDVTASATQGSTHTWDVLKTVTPDSDDLENTCPTSGRTSESIKVRVEWDKSAATPGAITGSAVITATNPAHRDLLIQVQSEIKSGTSSLSPPQTMDTGFVTLPPGETTFTHTFTAAAGTTDLNAVVTGTYKDPITGEILGSLARNAEADVTITQETPTNGSALITDVESITTGFKFRVVAVTGTTGGTFTPSYTPGASATLVTGLTWTYTASADGYVEFEKVVVADGPTNATATLSDTATAKSTDEQTTFDTASGEAEITTGTLAPITVNKTIPDVLDEDDADVTFTFKLKSGDTLLQTKTITFDGDDVANQDGKLEGSVAFGAVAPGNYTVLEESPTGWSNKDPQNVTIDSDPAECSDSVTFENDNDKATAKVRKQTLPSGAGAGWTFTLTKVEGQTSTVVDTEVTTDDGETDGYVVFRDGNGDPIELSEGSYVIEETMQDGYVESSHSTECSFTVDYPQSNGVTFDCTFVNQKLGSITVVKETVDVSGDDQLFDFTLDDDPNDDGEQSLSDGQSFTFEDLPADDYTLAEGLPVAGWDLTDISCVLSGTETEKSFTETLELGTAGIALDHGENVTCTFENTKEAKLIVEKQTDPAGSNETFVFEGDELPTDAGDRTLADNGTIEVDGLDAGSYDVSEVAEDGWDLTDITCDDSDSGGQTATATYVLDAGETVTCTFENTQRGTIIVEKQTQPNGATDEFVFTGDELPSDEPDRTLTDGEQIVVEDLVAGAYTASENDPEPGWRLAAISCDGDVPDGDGDNAASSGDVDTRTATFNLDPGETVTCTFTNTKRGSITVVKETDPDEDPATFQFDLDGDDADAISDGQSYTWGNLPDDTYSLSELLSNEDAWDLTDIDCGDAQFTEDLEAGSVDVTIDSGESGGANVTCTFTNTKRGSIVVEKQTDPDDSEELFGFTGDLEGSIADGGQLSGLNLEAGTYTVTETAEEGWDLTDITCDGDVSDDRDNQTSSGNVDTATATFELDPGEDLKCTFTNTERGSITVEKQTQPDGAEDLFTFTGEVLGQQGVQLSDGQTTTASSLQPGTYTVNESDPEPAWTLAGISCDGDVEDGEGGNNASSTFDVEARSATFELDPGEDLTCTFTNTKRGSITVIKQTDPEGDPATFQFDLDEDPSLPLSDGQSDTWGDLPDGSYTLSEALSSEDDWDLTDIDCGEAQVTENLEAGTVDVTIGSGENGGDNVTCTFTNTKRGSIIVEKQTNPDGAFGIFNFTGTAEGALSDGGQIRVDHLVPGQYTSTEGPSSFSLASIVCDDANSSGSVQTRTATFNLDPGEVVKCVFTNNAPPPPPEEPITDVEIDKADSTDPVTAGQNFDYILTVTNNGPDVAENVTVNDALPTGLGFVAVSTTKGECSGGATVTCSLGSLAVGESVTITITVSTSLESPELVENTGVVTTTTDESDTTNNQDTEPTVIVKPAPPQATIIVQKETIPLSDSTQTFDFSGDITGVLGDGDTASSVVEPGTYSVSETLPPVGDESRWSLLSIECDDTDSSGDVGSLTATFVAEEGETVTCVFTNLEEEVLPVFIPPEEEPPGEGPEVLPKPVEPGVLPFTGGEPRNLIALAFLMVLSGAGALLASRSRRTEE